MTSHNKKGIAFFHDDQGKNFKTSISFVQGGSKVKNVDSIVKMVDLSLRMIRKLIK